MFRSGDFLGDGQTDRRTDRLTEPITLPLAHARGVIKTQQVKKLSTGIERPPLEALLLPDTKHSNNKCKTSLSTPNIT
jgi:hypothetical protein